MTVSGLREKLHEADESQLRELICQLYRRSKFSQELIDSHFLGDDYGIRFAQETKRKMEQAFFPHVKIDRSLGQAKEILRHFRKSCQNQLALVDVELFFIECGLDFLGIFGETDEMFKDLLITNFASAVARILEDESQEYFHTYFSRCKEIISASEEFTHDFWQNMMDVYGQLVRD